MQQIIKSGTGWRIGWNPQAVEYKGLVGTENWSIELTEIELNDFCRLVTQLADTMKLLATELMDEEKITCEAESNLLWIEVEGYPHAYSLRLILNTGRCAEGWWNAEAVPGLLEAIAMLKVF
ncbi:DUF1818 family protein [Cronbergia sp. UHCC 0137]|uniref:DUF1818 family protein n=1 Tax=Cronbergia sp. UHCC 0137 TaxID=3110239 RepID=UPI002B20ED5B|nr:DUF1818 family protein [Cronbergia sp. UHCC 0137]MEA5616746.1 DUF1818 family protein [Cronbergia sp. UHCC 0137]